MKLEKFVSGIGIVDSCGSIGVPSREPTVDESVHVERVLVFEGVIDFLYRREKGIFQGLESDVS